MGKGLGIVLIIIGAIIVLFLGAVFFIVFSKLAAGTHYIDNWSLFIYCFLIFLVGMGLIMAGIKSMKS